MATQETIATAKRNFAYTYTPAGSGKKLNSRGKDAFGNVTIDEALEAFLPGEIARLEKLYEGNKKEAAMVAYLEANADRVEHSNSGRSTYFYINDIKVRKSDHFRNHFQSEVWAAEIDAFFDLTDAASCDRLADKLGLKYNGKIYE